LPTSLKSLSLRRFLFFVAVAAYVWTAVITITGGFVLRAAWLTASSRNPRGPLTIALIASAWYVLRHRQHWADDSRWLARPVWPRVVAAIAAAGALVAGIGWGSFIGGGPDASGYVSQADMWVRGVLTLPPPDWARSAPWSYGVWSSSPIGYGPNHTGDAIAPMYSPGLPMMMALFQFAGGPDAVYYVVPLLGAVAVWGSYLLGRRISGDWAGAIAALLLACSPPFLWMIVQPMSDVPVTACWAMAFVFAFRHRPLDALAAGAATAAAVLIRPNIVPLAICPALMLLTIREGRVRRLLLFGIAPALAAAVIAALNWHLNGSPVRSGYGSLGQIYEAARIPLNLERYTTWLVDMQTPLIFVGLFAPFVVRRAAGRYRIALVTTVYPIVALGLYLPYVAFEHWPFLRFLLPAYPGVLAGAGAVLVEGARRSRHPLVALASVALVAFAALHGWQAARRENTFAIETFDRRYARAVEFVRRLPQKAVIVSNVHSGTLHFYTGRDILRFEVMRPEDVDRALTYLREQGHPVYFVGDPNEVDYFRELFGRTRAAGQLDRAAHADLNGVVVYDLN
jgi:hypothetical protein